MQKWLATAPPIDPGRTVDAVGRDVAVRAVRPLGDVLLAAPPHVVVEQRTDIAAGLRGSPIVAALVARATATTSTLVAAPADVAAAIGSAAARPVVLVTDGLGGDAVMLAVRRLRPDAVIVDIGPNPDRVTAPAVFALGNSP